MILIISSILSLELSEVYFQFADHHKYSEMTLSVVSYGKNHNLIKHEPGLKYLHEILTHFEFKNLSDHSRTLP